MAEAAFEAQSKAVISSLRAFAKRHGVPIPFRFERSWDPASASPGSIEARLVDMIRKTVENMHMVHTVQPEDLPPFPLEYLEVAGDGDVAPGLTPPELWRRRLSIYFPGGPPLLNRDDRRRLLRFLMTDETLVPHRGEILGELARAFTRTEWPADEWVRDASGQPFRPPSLPLYLVRLTNIRWMNDTAEVHHRLGKVGRESSFSAFVKLLAGLPDDDAVYAAALLVDWLFVHLNFYPVSGLGHRSERIDFITNRLLFEEILNPWLERHGPADVIRRLAAAGTGRSRRILAALRNGFLQERLAGAEPAPAARPRNWLAAVVGQTARDHVSSEAPTPMARLSPIDLFPVTLPDLLAPLVDPASRLPEAIHYGLARSIVDGREYFSGSLLGRNLEALESAVRAAAPGIAEGVPWREIAAQSLAAAGELSTAPADWNDLGERDQSYVTPAELLQSELRSLPADWRVELRRRMQSEPRPR